MNEVLQSNVITNEERKTTEMDGIPEDVWMCLGEEGIDTLSI